MLRRVARELAYFGFFLALTVVLLWPHALDMDSAVADRGDPFHLTWVLDWALYAITHAPRDLYDAPMFYPHRYALAYSENLIGVAILVLPFYLLGLEPLTVYNIAFVLGFTLAGYGGAVLARQFTRNLPAVLTAGIIYGFVQYKWEHLSHLHVVSTGWIPLLFAALIAYRRRPATRRAALLCGAFVMNGLTSIHWLLFGSLAVAITILFWVLHGGVSKSSRFWLPLVGSLALGSLILLPFLMPYRHVSTEYQMKRHPSEVAYYSATWQDWFVPSVRSAIYAPIHDPALSKHERTLFPGLMPIFLTAAAIVLVRRREPPAEAGPFTAFSPWILRILDMAIVFAGALVVFGVMASRFAITMGGTELIAIESAAVPTMALVALIAIRWSKSLRTLLARSRFGIDEWSAALWIALGVIGSFGMNAFFHKFLFWHVPVMQSLRVPARWALISYAGLAVWSALGVMAMLERRTAWRRHAVSALIILLTLADVWPVIRWMNVVDEPPLVYGWMRANRERLGPFFILPAEGGEYENLLGSTMHHVPLVNGVSSYEPPLYERLRERSASRKFDDEFLRILEESGAHYVLIHASRLDDPTLIVQWLRQQLARGRLAFVRRFDNGPMGDYVFAVIRNAKNWQALRGPQSPDGAGHIPDENLARFLDGKTTYNASTTWWVDHPLPWAEVHRNFEIFGWAHAPSGIRAVKACFDEGRRCYPAELFPRADVTRKRPFYPKTDRPGFKIGVPRRPKGVPRQTDWYLEIVDGNGKVTRTSDFFITWH